MGVTAAIRAVLRGKCVMWCTHRRELIQQVSGTMSRYNLPHGFIDAKRRQWHGKHTYICSIDTLRRRLHNMPFSPDLVIWDEARHLAAKTWKSTFDHFAHAYHLGLDATPERGDGSGLGAFFGAMVNGPSIGELMDMGFLSHYRYYAPSQPDLSGVHVRMGEFAKDELAEAMEKPKIVGDAISHLQKFAPTSRTLVFCVSIKASMDMAAAFRAAGFNAMHLDGGFEDNLRWQIMEDFRNGVIQILCSVNLFVEGLDVPGVECVVMARPTMSQSLFLQMIGRGLRAAEGKEYCTIIDMSANCNRHGLPDDERTWSLSDSPNRRKKSDNPAPSVRVCAHCWATSRMGARACGECGTPFPVKERQVEQQDGELVELQRERERREARKAQGSARDLDALVATGMSRERAAHVLAARAEKDALKREAGELAERCRAAALDISYLPVSAREIAQAKPKSLRALIAVLSEALENAADMRPISEPNVRMARLV